MKWMHKLKNRSGMSLAEALLAVLILSLASMIVATGMPAARNAYDKIVRSSNARVMLSTAVTTLKNELGTAWDVRIDDNTSDHPETSGSFVTYYSSKTGARAKVTKSDGTDGNIVGTAMLDQFAQPVDFGVNLNPIATGKPLVYGSSSATGLYVTYDGVEYANGIISFTNLRVCRQGGTPIAELGGALTIRVLSAIQTNS